MITLVCTKCGTVLTVDDGFAGGVCRCSTCGTIQTVPAKGQQAAVGQAIFERRGRGAPQTSKDLEALGDAVTSSGLAGSGMLQQVRTPTRAAARSNGKLLWPALLGAAVAVVAGLWVVFGGKSKQPVPAPLVGPAAPDAPARVAPTGPAFGPVALDAGGVVVYLVDRGDATRAYTAALRRAVARSAASLGPTRKFQVRFWTADGDAPAFPTAPADATPATLAKLAAWMSDVPGGQATDAIDSLAAALAARPAELVLLTGKAWQLDDSFANEAAAKLAASPKTKVHAIALGGSAGSDALNRVAARTGGTYVEMDGPTLDAIGK